jgi:hypothetical protein
MNTPRYFELRGEAYNVVNHPVFGAPGQTSAQGRVVAETNSSFGFITFQGNPSRSNSARASFSNCGYSNVSLYSTPFAL